VAIVAEIGVAGGGGGGGGDCGGDGGRLHLLCRRGRDGAGRRGDEAEVLSKAGVGRAETDARAGAWRRGGVGIKSLLRHYDFLFFCHNFLHLPHNLNNQ
jgi:hypothetical protein